MRSDKEIDAEIVALKKALTLTRRWSPSTRKQLEAMLQVLERRMTPEQVEREWYQDESSDDYRDGDNELWAEADRASRWLMQERGYDEAPSQGL